MLRHDDSIYLKTFNEGGAFGNALFHLRDCSFLTNETYEMKMQYARR